METKAKANATHHHYMVGREVRETIARLGVTMLEGLLAPEESIKEIERALSAQALGAEGLSAQDRITQLAPSI